MLLRVPMQVQAARTGYRVVLRDLHNLLLSKRGERLELSLADTPSSRWRTIQQAALSPCTRLPSRRATTTPQKPGAGLEPELIGALLAPLLPALPIKLTPAVRREGRPARSHPLPTRSRYSVAAVSTSVSSSVASRRAKNRMFG